MDRRNKPAFSDKFCYTGPTEDVLKEGKESEQRIGNISSNRGIRNRSRSKNKGREANEEETEENHQQCGGGRSNGKRFLKLGNKYLKREKTKNIQCIIHTPF